jgi:hypothetical protein
MNANESDALKHWREFCLDNMYDPSDVHARRAFAAGWLYGSTWGTDAAMKAAEEVIRGQPQEAVQ